MAAPDPWAAFNPQPAPSAGSAAAPIIQTPASTKTQTETGILTDTKPVVERKATAEAVTAEATAKSAQYKATLDDLATAKQQMNDWGGAEQVDQLVNAVERAKALVGETTTGGVGSILKNVPGTDAFDLNKVIEQEVRGNVFLQRLQAMKEENNSPTGGTGIGRIMQAEIPMITGSSGTLDTGMKGSELTASLDQIERGALRMKAKLAGENPDDPAVQKKYGIPALPNYGAPGGGGAGGGAGGSGGGGGGGSTPSGISQLNDSQKQAYNAFLAANPNPSGDQIGTFLTKLTGKQVTNGADIAKAISQGRGTSTSVSTTVGQLLDNTKNDVAGIAEGAAMLPDMAAKAVGKVASVVPTGLGYGLDALGYGNAASYMHGIAHDLAFPAQVGSAVEGVAPTPTDTAGKINRFIGQMVGGAVGFPGSAAENVVSRFVGEVPKLPLSGAAKVIAPQTIVQDAKTAGVPVMTSDVRPPTTFIGKAAQAIGERIPITGTGGVRAAQQAARVDAVKSAAQEFGAATGNDLSSPAVDAVANDLAKQRGAELTRLTNQKNAVINKFDTPVATPKAIGAIDQQIGNLGRINSDAYAPVIAKLQSFHDQLASGKTLSQIEGNRKLLGDMFADPSLAAIRGDGEKALSAIYGPLREDMGSFIKSNGGDGDFNKWTSANDALAGMVGDLKNAALKKALSTADATPENVSSLLFSQKPSDVRMLYAGLSPAGRAKAQAAIIQRAVEKAGGMDGLSPDRFATQIGALGKSVGVFFQGDDLARVEGLARVLKVTQRASQAALAPPTGVQAVPYAMGAGFSEALGIPGGITAALGTGLLARAYESAPVRNLLLKLGQSKPGTQQERFLTQRIGAAITAATQKPTAATALNQNMPQMGALAASPDQRPNQQQ